jgi:hypothetical protein
MKILLIIKHKLCLPKTRDNMNEEQKYHEQKEQALHAYANLQIFLKIFYKLAVHLSNFD